MEIKVGYFIWLASNLLHWNFKEHGNHCLELALFWLLLFFRQGPDLQSIHEIVVTFIGKCQVEVI
jgi:hypothetical protein